MARRKARKQDPRKEWAARMGTIVVAAAVLAGVGVIGAWRLWQGLTGMEMFAVEPSDPFLESGWIRSEAMRADFLANDESGVLATPCSIFAAGLSERVADAYAASPWVRRVKGVRKVFPNRLDIELEMREPFALVQVGERSYCVDEDGMVLDPTVYDLRWERLSALGPRVVLSGPVRTPLARQAWTDMPVTGGLAMVRLCREQFLDRVNVGRIEVESSRARDGSPQAMAWLVLQNGPRVYWGHVPTGEGSTAEIETPEKAAVLLAVVTKEGGNLRRIRTLDVRWDPPLCELRAKGE